MAGGIIVGSSAVGGGIIAARNAETGGTIAGSNAGAGRKVAGSAATGGKVAGNAATGGNVASSASTIEAALPEVISSVNPSARAPQPASPATTTPVAAANGDGILLIGDSLMKAGIGPVLARTLAAAAGLKVTNLARSSTGLSRPEFYDWPATAQRLFDTKKHYRYAVALLGTNDCQSIDVDGRAVSFGTSDWQDAYRDRLTRFMTQLCAVADHVYWLGLPAVRQPKFNAKLHQLNELMATTAAGQSCVTYIPTAPLLGDAHGSYRQYGTVGGRKVKIRDDDGIHVNQGGGWLIAEKVAELVKATFEAAKAAAAPKL